MMGTEHRFRLRHISPKGPAFCVTATRLGHEFPDDPADRLIAATAMLESAALVTKDARIRRYSAVETIW
jgi:PIN domain nuclease of toxin-antitoxin system